MSRRKHVTLALAQDVQPPADGQSIVRALGSRGGNIVEVEYPDGRLTLVLMPARFNKKLWVRRGGYLIVDEAEEAAADDNSRVTGTIVSVLYDEHVRQLKRTPGVWPPEFTEDAAAGGGGEASSSGREAAAGPTSGSEGEEEEESEDSLEPLHQNSNRRVVYYEVSDSDEEDEESSDAADESSGGEDHAAASGEQADGGGAEGQRQTKGRLTDEEQDKVLGVLGAKLAACELGKRPAA